METFDEIRLILSRLAKSQEETGLMIKDLLKSQEETGQIFKDLAKKNLAYDKRLAEQGKQIGGIGNKFGYLVEGLAYSSVDKILRKDFGVDHVAARMKVEDKTTKEIIAEIDIFGYCNSDLNNAVLVEVKSQLRPEEVEEFVAVLNNFNSLFPEHKGKNVYGIIATPIVFDEGLQKRIKNLGIGTATIHEETFKMTKNNYPTKNWRVA